MKTRLSLTTPMTQATKTSETTLIKILALKKLLKRAKLDWIDKPNSTRRNILSCTKRLKMIAKQKNQTILISDRKHSLSPMA